jgi:predicted component of type VI protein secretion system
MDFELVIVQGRSTTNTLKLADGVTTIGRLDECQLRIKSSQVSRKHCELFEKKGLLLVKDLGSSNGTLVNGKRIKGQRVLEPGDELTIGPVHLRVAKVGAAAPGKPASKPGDTAVTPTAIAVDESEGFTIDFDEPTPAAEDLTVPAPSAPSSKKAPKGKAPAHDDDAIADFLMDIDIEGDEEEAPSPASKAAPAPPSQPVAEVEAVNPEVKTSPAGEKGKDKEPPKEKEVSDDAIADFLLDIKLDDDE